MESTPIKYSGWLKGVNNIASDADMPANERGIVNTLRDAVNVDILNSGIARRRVGISKVLDDAGAHSAYANDTLMVWATSNTLRVSTNVLSYTTVLTDTRLAKPISFETVNGDIYFSNEDINGIIRADGTYEPWGIQPPTTTPVPTCVTGPNKYQITCTFVTASGEESGAPLGRSFLCEDRPAIRISNVPQSSDPRVVATRVYMTNIDGVELQQVIDLPTGITSWSLSGFFAYGESLKTQFMQPPPPGQLIELHDGVIYIASGKNVFHTQPLRFGMYNPESDFFMYPSRVTMVKEVDNGLYVCADGLHFLPQIGTDDVSQNDVMPYKAVEGAVCDLPDTKDFMFVTDRGIVRASVSGQVLNLTEENIAIDSYDRGVLCYTNNDGHKAVVGMFKNGQQNPAVAKDFLDNLSVWKAEKALY
jgi:hypothetical protein